MKNALLFSYILLTFTSCKNKIERLPKPYELTIEDVFPKQQNTESTFVVRLDTVKSFSEIRAVLCNYSNYKQLFFSVDNLDIEITDGGVFTCNNNMLGCFKSRYAMIVENDSVFSHRTGPHVLSVDLFSAILRKQFLNNGKDPMFASRSSGTVFFEVTSGMEPNLYNNRLDTVAYSYYKFLKGFGSSNLDSLKKRYPLYISFEPKLIPVKIPPPPPTSLEIE